MSVFLLAFAACGGTTGSGVDGSRTGQVAEEVTTQWAVTCNRFPPTEPEIARCASWSGEELALKPGLVEGERPEAFLVEAQLYYALASGRTAPVHWFDNGPDPFVEGLARSPLDGRFGFVDERLDLVVPRKWDFAFPFENGFAKVCRGCEVLRSKGEEHTEVLGGLWGWVGLDGEVVVSVEYAFERLPDPS